LKGFRGWREGARERREGGVERERGRGRERERGRGRERERGRAKHELTSVVTQCVCVCV